MDIGSLIASLGIDSSALRKSGEEFKQLDKVAQASVKSMEDSFSSAILGMVTKAAMAVGAIYGISTAVKFSINAMEEFRLTTIQIAVGLTNMAKEGQGGFETMLARNLEHAKAMHEEIRKEDAKRFASAQDLMTAYNALVQKGYSVRLDEVDALGVLTDKIKLATAGQNTQMQINQEIRSLLDGQARAGSLLGMELKSRIGPGWEEVLRKQRESGNLLKYLAELWPGISVAAKEVENTIEAQKTTLVGNLKAIGREGMGGAYQDIVNLLKMANDFLRDHESVIGRGIARGWEVVRDITSATLGFLRDMAEVLTTISGIVADVVRMSPLVSFFQWAPGFLARGGPDIIPGFALAPDVAESMEFKTRQNQALAEQAARYKRETFQMYAKGLGQTEAKPMPFSPEGGGKGIESAQHKLESFMMTMESEMAKAVDDTLGGLNVWYSKQEKALREITEVLGEQTEARKALEEAYWAKAGKIADDYYSWVEKESGDETRAINREMDTRLRKFRYVYDEMGNVVDNYHQIEEIRKRKLAEADVKQKTEWLSLQKGLFDSLAGTMPLLSDQLAFKERALEIELRISGLQKEQLLQALTRKGIIKDSQADEARGLMALEAQAKRYALVREAWLRQGPAGGLRMWAFERRQEMETRAARDMAEAMKGTEVYLADTAGNALVDAFHRRKTDIRQMFMDVGDASIRMLARWVVRSGFDMVAATIGVGTALGRRGDSPARPLYVSDVGFGKGLGGFGPGELGMGGVDLEEFGTEATEAFSGWIPEAEDNLSIVADYFGEVFTVGSGELMGAGGGIFDFISQGADLLVSALSGLFGGGGEVLSGILGFAGSIFGFHGGSGGPIGQVVYAHSGWPEMAHNEVPAILLRTERVLSPEETKAYEAGLDMGGGTAPDRKTIIVNLGGLKLMVGGLGPGDDAEWIRLLDKVLYPRLKEKLSTLGREF